MLVKSLILAWNYNNIYKNNDKNNVKNYILIFAINDPEGIEGLMANDKQTADSRQKVFRKQGSASDTQKG